MEGKEGGVAIRLKGKKSLYYFEKTGKKKKKVASLKVYPYILKVSKNRLLYGETGSSYDL